MNASVLARCVLVFLLLPSLMAAEEPSAGRTLHEVRPRFAELERRGWVLYSSRWSDHAREHAFGSLAPADEVALWCGLCCWSADNGEQLPEVRNGDLRRLKETAINGLYVDARPFPLSVGRSRDIGVTAEILRELKELNQLECVSLRGIRLSSESVGHLDGMHGLRRLLLAQCDVSLGEVVRGLSKKPGLKQLVIRNDAGGEPRELTSEDVDSLAERFPALEELQVVSACRAGHDALRKLTELKSLKRLCVLDARQTPVGRSSTP